MKLLKFNLIFVPFLALCLGVVAYIAREMLLEDARQHVIQNARIIMETMLSSRTYTTKQIAPLLEQKNFKLQTAISEFRKTITEIPKTPDPTAGKDIKGPAKKSFLLGQQQALRRAGTVPDIGQRQTGGTARQRVPPAIGSRVRSDRDICLFARKIPRLFL